MNDENNQSAPTEETPAPISELAPTPIDSISEPSISVTEVYPTKQIDFVNSEPPQLDSSQPAPAPPTSATPPTQSLAQQDERGFIKSLLIKAQAKIQFNKQKKLEKIILLAQMKKTITNDDVQKLLYVSDATATRYLVKLVQQARLTRVGSPRDAKYQFVR